VGPQGWRLAVPLAGLLDLDAEDAAGCAARIDKLAREREGHAAKLRNPDFLARAKPEVVDKVRAIDRELGGEDRQAGSHPSAALDGRHSTLGACP